MGRADEQLAELVADGGDAAHRPVDDDEHRRPVGGHEEVVRTGVAVGDELREVTDRVEDRRQPGGQLGEIGAQVAGAGHEGVRPGRVVAQHGQGHGQHPARVEQSCPFPRLAPLDGRQALGDRHPHVELAEEAGRLREPPPGPRGVVRLRRPPARAPRDRPPAPRSRGPRAAAARGAARRRGPNRRGRLRSATSTRARARSRSSAGKTSSSGQCRNDCTTLTNRDHPAPRSRNRAPVVGEATSYATGSTRPTRPSRCRSAARMISSVSSTTVSHGERQGASTHGGALTMAWRSAASAAVRARRSRG